YQIGMLTFGPLDRVLDTRKWIVVFGTVAIILTLALMALTPRLPVALAVGGILAIGFFSACSTMVMAHGRGIIPDRLIGRGMATINTSVMFGVACMQTVSGVVIGAFEPLASGARSEAAYRALFGVLATILIVALSVYGRSVDVKPSDQMRESAEKAV